MMTWRSRRVEVERLSLLAVVPIIALVLDF
jgi:hypothetical protein